FRTERGQPKTAGGPGHDSAQIEDPDTGEWAHDPEVSCLFQDSICDDFVAVWGSFGDDVGPRRVGCHIRAVEFPPTRPDRGGEGNRRMRKSRLTRLLAGVLAIGLAASACGDNKSSSSSTTAASGASTTVAPATTAAPVKGGTITVGQYSRENGLDPTKLNGGGTVGGSELAALYDTLMRYNPETGK